MKKKMADYMQIKSHRYLTIGVLLVLIAAIFGYRSLHHASAAPATRKPAGEQVTVASVGSLSPAHEPLSIIGQVTSLNQATILSQVAGEVVTLNAKIGDHVSAGETIAVLENSSQQAAVIQAQGAYDASKAELAETIGSDASATGDQSSMSPSADQSSQNAATGAIAALQTTYTALDDAIHTKADTLFSFPRSQYPALNTILTYTNDIQLSSNVIAERKALEPVLADADSLTAATTTDIDTVIGSMIADAQTVETFLSNLNEIIAETTPASNTATAIASFQTTVGVARTEVVNAVTSLNTAKTTYDSVLNGSAVQQADVEGALGALDAARSALAKTIITSPISGTIVDLPVTAGDYVSSQNEVAEVSNPSALKLVAHVSAADAKTLSIGNTASVNGAAIGTITQISPAIDPQTGTIEVDVTLTGDQTGLTDGDSVTVDLDRASSSSSSASAPSASNLPSIIIPIVALKITPTGPEVFTVDADTNTLVAHPVQIGSILGQNIVVTQGLTPDLMIVTDARGFVSGEKVSVKQS